MNLTKVGTGTQTINATALSLVYFGATTVSGGTLTMSTTNNMPFLSAVSVASGATFNPSLTQSIGSLTGAGNVTIGSSQTLLVGNDNTSPAAFTGIISGASSILTKVGTGTLTLAGTGTNVNSYTGATNVTGGTLALDLSSLTTPTNLTSSSSIWNVGSASVTINGKPSAVTSQTFNGLNLFGGASLSITNNSATSTTVVLGNIARNTTATAVNFSFTSPGSFTTTKANTATSILGGWATVNGTDWAVTGASGTNPVTALGVYATDDFTTSTNDVNVTVADVPTPAFTINSLRFNTTGGLSVTLPSGANSITSGGILVTSAVGAGGASIGGSGTLTSGNTTDLIVNQYDPTGTFTISAPITGTIGFTKTGPGTVALSGTSNFVSSNANPISVLGGTLAVAFDGIGSSVPSPLGSTLTGGTTGDIIINGGTLLATSTFRLNANRLIQLGPNITGSGAGNVGFGTIAVATGQTLGYSGTITNKNALDSLIVGSSGNTGTLYLSGGDSFSGATQIKFGTLMAGTTNEIGTTSAVQVSAGANYVLNGFANSIGSLTGAGNVTDNSGVSVTLTVGGDNTSPAAFSGVISNTTGSGTGFLSLSKTTGTGRLLLSGPNTYGPSTAYVPGMTVVGGLTTISSGILECGATNTLPLMTQIQGSSVGTLVLNGFSQSVGSLGVSQTTAITNNSATNVILTIGNDNLNANAFSGVISNFTQAGSGTLGITKVGAGNQVLSATNLYTGPTTVSGGVLQANTALTIPALSAVSVAANAALMFNAANPSIGSLTGAGIVTANTGMTLSIGSDNTSPAAFSGVLENTYATSGGVLSVTKVGTGTLILSGPNAYTGTTTIGASSITLTTYGAGTVQTGAVNPIPLFSPVTDNGTLLLNGFSQSFDALNATQSLGGLITNSNAANVTLSIGNNNGTGTFNGQIVDGAGGGKLSLVKDGTGSETLGAGLPYRELFLHGWHND